MCWLESGVCDFEAQSRGGRSVGATENESVRTNGRTTDNEVNRVAPIALLQDQLLDILGDAETVLMRGGVVCATVVGRASIVVIVRQETDSAVRLADALQGEIDGVDQIQFMRIDIRDDKLSTVNGHPLIVLIEAVLQMREGDACLHTATALHVEDFFPNLPLPLQHLLYEVGTGGGSVVVVKMGEPYALVGAGESVSHVCFAVVVVIQGDAAECTGHVSDQHVTAVAGMPHSLNIEPFQKVRKIVVQIVLVVEQVLPELFCQRDAQVCVIDTRVHNDWGGGLYGIATGVKVQRRGVVGGGAGLVVFRFRIKGFGEFMDADVHAGVCVSVISGYLQGEHHRVDNGVFAKVDGRAAQ